MFEADNPHDALNAWDPEILEPDVELIGWGQDMDSDDQFTLYNDDLFTYPFTIGASTMPAIACGETIKLLLPGRAFQNYMFIMMNLILEEFG